MKKSSTILLQVIVVLIGLGTLALLLWEPRIEGRNALSTNYEIYFKDPFLMLVYAGSIPFFIALYQVFQVLRYVGQNKAFSPEVLKALRAIKYCAITIIGFVGAEEVFIMLNHGSDDAAGGVFMGLLIIFGSGVVVIVAKMLERILRNALEMKSENDLTV